MTRSDGDGETPAVRLRPIHRLLLAARIWGDSLRVWRGLRRRRVPEVVERLDREGRVQRPVDPRRLGRLVHRAMNLGPFQPRCLTMSLVLFRELRRQGTAAELVIGLPLEPTEHAAHAWIEVDGQVVGPPPGRLGHAEMARYGGSSGTSSSTRSRDARCER